MKKILVVSTILLVLLTADDAPWQNRNSVSGAKDMYNYYQKNYQQVVTYEAAWQYARACYFYGEYIVTNEQEKKDIFTAGRNAALQAVKISKEQSDGHYWLGVCTGGWAEANGVMKSLTYADDIAAEMSKVIELDPAYKEGSAYMVRAKVYYKAPGFPLSVGDDKKAQADFTKAWGYGKNNRKLHRFYADYLLSKNKKTEALAIIEQGLALPLQQDKLIEENTEIELLEALKKETN